MVNRRSNGVTVSLRGIGTSVPRHSVETPVSAEFAAHSLCIGNSFDRKIKALYRRSGIERRGSVLLDEDPGPELREHAFYPAAESEQDRGPSTKVRNDRFATEAPRLARESASRALAAADARPDEITHLVTVCCTGFFAPGIDISLIDDLGLPATTQRIQIGFMGCHAAINGLRAAEGLVAANPGANVLMVCVELCSLHLQYGMDADRIVSNSLFADGSSAAVISGETASGNYGELVATGSYLMPESRDAMTWRIADHGFEMTLSAIVPNLIEQHLVSFLDPWLSEQGESIESIGGWAVHPGGPRIVSAVQAALGLTDHDLQIPRDVLKQRGNMSSATMLFILNEFQQSSQPKPWLLMGFGPGLELEVALVR
ncbi:MAG: type III polyketide synthase [Rubripirellula sp.]|nr:type III polyketide synthase [Rubripirellula sp.]